ncbi:MAG: nucleotidyltransferase family protein [Proteobacteria bacterium]|nr:nucleotidyltransferase family protein [Pseudomonadota bacterium]MBU1709542.1 nucleotidyltransferase family protein [Pseudomonadota bacterium]
MNLMKILQNKKEEILSIAQSHGAISLRLFGSLARGDDHPESDIDFLVEMEPGRSLLDLIAMKHEIEDLIHKKVDVLTEQALSPYIRKDVLRDSIAL